MWFRNPIRKPQKEDKSISLANVYILYHFPGYAYFIGIFTSIKTSGGVMNVLNGFSEQRGMRLQ